MSQTPSTFKVIGLVLLATLLGGLLFAQETEQASPSDLPAETKEEESAEESEATPQESPEAEPETKETATTVAPLEAPAPVGASAPASPEPAKTVDYALLQILFLSLTIFVLAVFLGIEVISKVPPTLHTPLMSGSNAISGITLVGAVIVASSMSFSGFVGFIAVTLATVNAVGGFMVTHRMLAMFRKR